VRRIVLGFLGDGIMIVVIAVPVFFLSLWVMTELLGW